MADKQRWRKVSSQHFECWDEAYLAGLNGQYMPAWLATKFLPAYELGRIDAESVGLRVAE